MAIEEPNCRNNTYSSLTMSTSNPKHEKQASFSALFSAADRLDIFLMIFGSIGAAIHGASVSYFFILFGNLIDSLGRLSSDPLTLSHQVSKYSLYLVYLGLLVFASSWMGVAFWMQAGERQTNRLRINYLEAILSKSIEFFDIEAEKDNVVFHISSDAILVQEAIGEKVGHSIRYLSQFIVGFAIGFSSVWQLTVITLAVVPLIAFSGGAYALTMSSISKKTEAAYAEAAKAAEESISQIRTVQANVGEEKAIEVYSRSLQSALKLGKKSGFAKGIGIGCTYGLLFCSWSLLIWYASLLVRRNNTNGGKAFTTIVNVIYSGFALGQAAPNLAAIAKGKAAATKILDMIGPQESSRISSDHKTLIPNIVGRIEFSEVSFSYPSRSKTVFEDLSFSVDAGKALAVVGQSGSGKSTIISLLQRFYQPISGKILLDGHDLQNLQLKWLREQMGLVSQEPVLFATSIAENILYGNEKADREQIIKASESANADSFIKTLPDGYYTQVGEGGAQLSGGQKQRIAIARAVLRNPKILLLDEATSALDSESEMTIQKALDKIKSNRTTIVVAHRLSTIYGVDKIIVLNNGCVVETGTHMELMEKGEEYATLIRIQGSDYSTNESNMETSKREEIKDQIVKFQESTTSFRELKTSKSEEVRNKSEGLISPSLKEVVKLSGPEWPSALLGCVGAVLAGIEPPAFALCITYILNSFYSHDNSQIKHDVKVVSLVFLGLAFATIPIYILQHYFCSLMGERITTRVRLLMFSAMLSNEIGWFDLDENSIGSLTSKLAADATLVRSSLADRLPTIVQNLTLTFCAFAISFKLCWRVAAVTVGIFPLLIGASMAENLFLKGFGGNHSKSYSRATSLAREAIANIRTVASFGAEKRISRQYSLELSLPKKQAFLNGHISGICYGVSQLLAFSSYALTLYYASTLIKNKYSNFGNIMKSFMMLMVTAFSVAETLALTPEMVKGSKALDSVFSILKRKANIESNSLKPAVNAIKGEIKFKNITFKYPSRTDVTILEGMNLKIAAGTSVAILGQSGSGKSTLISLVMRFYDPTIGSILIDGVDIKALNLKSLRQKIGLVQQEPALFSATIYENIKYGNENATEIEIREAAMAANAHEFISRMPEGYKTQVGEKGVQLSGGQKQRIAIARAIIKDPRILLLDEATSALDMGSEKLVQEALEKVMQRRTTIVVAHRLSTIKKVDYIVVVESGRVVETGSHQELLERPGGCYAQLISLQQQSMQQNS